MAQRPLLLYAAHLALRGFPCPTAALFGSEDAVRDVVLRTVELQSGGIAARWSLRVLNAKRLDAHFRQYLPGRGIPLYRGGPTQNTLTSTDDRRIP